MGTKTAKKKVLLLRNSERQDYKRCRWRWNVTWNMELKPNTVKPPLRFGDLIHRSLEPYYKPGKKRGPHPAKTFARLYAEQREEVHAFGMRQEDDEWVNAEELGVAMLEHYVDRYGKDDRIEIIAAEMPFQVDIFHPDTGLYVVTAVGTFDAVYRDLATNQIGLIDHKTAKSIQTGHLPMDEQAGTYFALAPEFLRAKGILKPKQKLSHIMYNYLRKAKPDPRPTNELGQALNKDGSVSKVQPSPFFERPIVYRDEADRENILWRIRTEAWEHKRARAGKLPIGKTPTKDCSWDCDVRDACELHETGSDFESLLELSFKKWEPYSAHNMYERGER